MEKVQCNFAKMRPRSDIGVIYKVAGANLRDNPDVTNIQQVQANSKTIAQIERILYRGALRTFNYMTEKRIRSMVSMTMLGWAPSTNEDVPDNELWILSAEELKEQRERKVTHE